MKSLAIAMGLWVLGSSVAAQGVRPTVPPPVTTANARDDAGTILERYARAWRGSAELPVPQAAALTLGFEVSGVAGGDFVVTLPTDAPGSVARQRPGRDAPVFVTDIETLRRLDRGEMSALTAMGRARASDPVPMDIRMPPDFRWTAEARGVLLPLIFHFFTRGVPEIVRFGEGANREVHGGLASVLYYDVGLRVAFYQVRAGMHLNRGAEDQTNPFPTLVIVTRGVFQARLGGEERTMREGEALLVPAGMSHEFWATARQYGEFVVIMFGGGA